uniref:Survival Motor Neuron Gemin2-binding domain-containing protein n=1 Tax=Eptatretus burgeri TaxID=7764 RepID=A0A8C4WY96_EPTBU
MSTGHNRVVYQKGQNDDDIWDDTALIKAYDKALASFKNALKADGGTSETGTEPEVEVQSFEHSSTQNTYKRKNRTKKAARKKKMAQVQSQNCPFSPEESDVPDPIPHGSRQRKPTARHRGPSLRGWQFPSPPLPPPFSYPAMPPPWFSFPSFAGMPPVVPPPPIPPNGSIEGEDEALGTMLMSWYMSGYHTGYYLGLQHGRRGEKAYRGFCK